MRLHTAPVEMIFFRNLEAASYPSIILHVALIVYNYAHCRTGLNTGKTIRAASMAGRTA